MRPKCKECDKQLPKYTWMFNQWEDLTHDQIEEKAREKYGSNYQGITSIRPILGTTHILVNIWLGEYGYAGNGHFCSKECGFRWAVSKARREARDQEQYSRIIRQGEV